MYYITNITMNENRRLANRQELYEDVMRETGSRSAAEAADIAYEEYGLNKDANARRWPPNDTTLMTSADWVH